ncbi:MAG: hypothetical protein WCF36_16920 [Candidatus Nanopelagicales bacterium]
MIQLAAAAADAAESTATTSQLALAFGVGIATVIVLIVWLKLHPFLSLTLGAGTVAVIAGSPVSEAFTSFTAGFGSTVAGVGILIVLGAIIGTMLVTSGGADEIVDVILSRTPTQRLPWAMALIAFVIGIPLFFEVGVVILLPGSSCSRRAAPTCRSSCWASRRWRASPPCTAWCPRTPGR